MYKAKKKTRRRNTEINTPLMQAGCIRNGVTYTLFNAGSYRLKKGEKVIDYYPASEKCFFHSDQSWGEVTNIRGFIDYDFGSK